MRRRTSFVLTLVLVSSGIATLIAQTTVVFRQEVNDPTSIERYRERVMDLAPTTGAVR